MRLVMMGTGPFAVPTFEALCDSDNEVAFLVTRPDPRGRRSRKRIVKPMRDVAHQRNVQVHEPSNVNSPEFAAVLQEINADLFVVCDYGQILSADCLSLARLGGINLHGSLLPKYRGAAPVHWSIFHGEQTTGITVIHMTPRLDSGPMLVQRSIEIEARETTAQLEPRLAEFGAPAVMEAISMLESWDGQSSLGEFQDPALATRAPRLKREDGAIDWSRSATQLFNQVRAFQPWPGSYTSIRQSDDRETRVILHETTVIDESPSMAPGLIESSAPGPLVVACGQGKLQIDVLQPAGKRAMSSSDYLRGHKIQPGDRLG